MAHFTLDTSGMVKGYVRDFWLGASTPQIIPGRYTAPNEWGIAWDDLSPFAQGCVEAMLRSLPAQYRTSEKAPEPKLRRFRDLAPETLALILRDCEAYERRYPATRLRTDHRARGANYWRDRQKGLKPLTPYLGDDGKVYLREAA
jgi:hypothetical protein